MRLAKEVGQSKPDIEGRISKMNHLVVKENQFASKDKRILWTEVAVNQTLLTAQRLLRQCVEETGRRRGLLSRVEVVRLYPKVLEVSSVCKRSANFRPRL